MPALKELIVIRVEHEYFDGCNSRYYDFVLTGSIETECYDNKTGVKISNRSSPVPEAYLNCLPQQALRFGNPLRHHPSRQSLSCTNSQQSTRLSRMGSRYSRNHLQWCRNALSYNRSSRVTVSYGQAEGCPV